MPYPEKSYAGLGHHTCPACYIKHGEVVLIDRHLGNTLTTNIFMGYKLCPDCAKESDEYLYLIGVDEESKQFTGQHARIRWVLAKDLLGDHITRKHPFVVTTAGVLSKLEQLSHTGAK